MMRISRKLHLSEGVLCYARIRPCLNITETHGRDEEPFSHVPPVPEDPASPGSEAKTT